MKTSAFPYENEENQDFIPKHVAVLVNDETKIWRGASEMIPELCQ